jgi:hypothetical protein
MANDPGLQKLPATRYAFPAGGLKTVANVGFGKLTQNVPLARLA